MNRQGWMTLVVCVVAWKGCLGASINDASDQVAAELARTALTHGPTMTLLADLTTEVGPRLAGRIRSAVGESGSKLESDPDMADDQCLLFHYPSAFPRWAPPAVSARS